MYLSQHKYVTIPPVSVFFSAKPCSPSRFQVAARPRPRQVVRGHASAEEPNAAFRQRRRRYAARTAQGRRQRNRQSRRCPKRALHATELKRPHQAAKTRARVGRCSELLVRKSEARRHCWPRPAREVHEGPTQAALVHGPRITYADWGEKQRAGADDECGRLSRTPPEAPDTRVSRTGGENEAEFTAKYRGDATWKGGFTFGFLERPSGYIMLFPAHLRSIPIFHRRQGDDIGHFRRLGVQCETFSWKRSCHIKRNQKKGFHFKVESKPITVRCSLTFSPNTPSLYVSFPGSLFEPNLLPGKPLLGTAAPAH